MDLQADAMTEPVTEVLAVLRRRDQVTGGGVRLLGALARRDRAESRSLSFADQLVDLARGAARLPDREGARAIRAVAVQLAAHVEHNELALADLALPRLGVRKGA